MTGEKELGRNVGESEARPFGKRRAIVAGQDQPDGDERRNEQGEPGRLELAPEEGARAEPESQQEQEGRERKEVAGGAHGGPCLGNEDRELVHEAGNSFCLTLVLVTPLAICALGPGTAGWDHIAVAAGYYTVLFVFSSWATRRWGSEEGLLARTAFVESRLAIVLLGFAAVAFRSPGLLEIAPDILAVAIAGSGFADGTALGLAARRQGCSWVRALGFAVGICKLEGRP